MKLHQLYDEAGHLYAFEVNNLMLSRTDAVNIVNSIPGARIIRKPGFCGYSFDDEFCEFKLGDKTFVIYEPWGDSSRFWIGQKQPGWCPELDKIAGCFQTKSFPYGAGGTVRLLVVSTIFLLALMAMISGF
ncbi:MAG: hypothetical protein KC900_00145 [Candidatus Omnitrophica bacterium]|nr:hypothetical protein [Candidatus Omnitrophota bacterium]